MCVTIISVGGGGFNLAEDLINEGTIRDIQFIVCDTDPSSLEAHAERACKSYLLERIDGNVNSGLSRLVDKVLDATCDKVIICATLGGNAGSKYAPLMALNALQRDKFVCSVITKPYEFEGDQLNQRANDALMKIGKVSNLTILQNNNELKRIEGLGLGDMDKPIIETIGSALKAHSMSELSSLDNDKLETLIPEIYRLADTPLVAISGDDNSGLQISDRCKLFDGTE